MNLDHLERVLPLVFYGIAIGGIAWTAVNLRRSVRARHWCTVVGEVSCARVVEKCEDDAEGGESCTYEPRIEYRYAVQGTEYRSRRFAFGFLASSFASIAHRIHERFRSGATIKVYYDPRQPQDAVLLTGVQDFHLLNLAFFTVVFGITYWATSG